MKSVFALSLFVALGLSQQTSECGQTCINNMLAKASSLGCEPKDMACLCENMDFGFGVRDCTTEACPNADIESIVAKAEAMCPDGPGGPGNSQPTNGPTSEPEGSGTNGPTKTATSPGEPTDGPGNTNTAPNPTGTNSSGAPNPTGGDGGDDDGNGGDGGDNTTNGPTATGTGPNGGGGGGNGGSETGPDGSPSATGTEGAGAPGETTTSDDLAAPMVTSGPAIAGALGLMAFLAV